MSAVLGRRQFLMACAGGASGSLSDGEAAAFEGEWYAGAGDPDDLRLLDTARGMFAPNPRLQSIDMLYQPEWNGFVEGPGWDAWWIQNSYGTTYCALPFLTEPHLTFLQNAQDLWFDQMGDGRTAGANGWVAPDGCLCDAARPGWVVYRQGDGRTDIHDWAVEFTAAGLLLQAELLLISRDLGAVARYLPLLERCAEFLETRRDPAASLYRAGPAANLLAPSYAGWRRPDGTYGMAYLAGLSVTTIAALDRLVELERLAGRPQQAAPYEARARSSRAALPRLLGPDGCFVRSIDPDGTRHGVYGQERHGYIDAAPNHDAVALGVVDDKTAHRIVDRLTSIGGLRPHTFVLANYPGLDDMYERPEGIWAFGTWVNGGHWSTCEARMVLAYYRTGRHDDARRSMRKLLEFAERFALDNPLSNFGATVSWYRRPVYLTYDAFGPPAALVRGLFGYRYTARGLVVTPRLPAGIQRLDQRFPVRLGASLLTISTAGSGTATSATLNGRRLRVERDGSMLIEAEGLPREAHLAIGLGGSAPPSGRPRPRRRLIPRPPEPGSRFWRDPDSSSSVADNGLPLRIGASSEGGNRFLGEVADVRLYARDLSEPEVAALARGGEVAEGLVARWPLDTLADGRARCAGAGPWAAAAGAVSLGGRSPVGGSLRLHGGYLEAAYDADLALPLRFTLAAWVRPDTLVPEGMRIVDKVTVGAEDGYLLDCFTGGELRLITPFGHLRQTADGLQAGRWVHVAGVCGSGRIALFADGRRIAERTAERVARDAEEWSEVAALAARLYEFAREMRRAGLGRTYEAAHAELALHCVEAWRRRRALLASGGLAPLEGPARAAADRLYRATAAAHCRSVARRLDAMAGDPRSARQPAVALWQRTGRRH